MEKIGLLAGVGTLPSSLQKLSVRRVMKSFASRSSPG